MPTPVLSGARTSPCPGVRGSGTFDLADGTVLEFICPYHYSFWMKATIKKMDKNLHFMTWCCKTFTLPGNNMNVQAFHGPSNASPDGRRSGGTSFLWHSAREQCT
jgi:hypothetical protein